MDRKKVESVYSDIKDKKLDKYLFSTVREFLDESPLIIYNQLISELRYGLTPNSCGCRCRFVSKIVEGEIIPRLPLVRSTHKVCDLCNTNSVSLYDHNICYKCATIGVPEYEYHHSGCQISFSLCRVINLNS